MTIMTPNRAAALQKAQELACGDRGTISFDDENYYDATIPSFVGVVDAIRTILVHTDEETHTIIYY